MERYCLKYESNAGFKIQTFVQYAIIYILYYQLFFYIILYHIYNKTCSLPNTLTKGIAPFGMDLYCL